MAKKINIVGNALVVTSKMSLANIKLLEKFDPKALSVYEADEDGHKQQVFRVSSTTGDGVIGKYGACFADETRDEEKLATVTMTIPRTVTNAVDWAEDNIGVAVAYLEKVEAQATAALEVVAAKRKALREAIEVI